MSHNFKRFFCFLLAMFMVIGLVPINTARAEETPALPEAEVTELNPMTLVPETHKQNVWLGGDNLAADEKERPLQAVVNFKAKDTLEEALAGGYSKWLVDFYLTFSGLPEEGLLAKDCYLAGNYGSFGWIVIPTDTLTVKNGEEYPVVSNYDPTLNYKDICSSVKDFTAALYVAPAILEANPNLTVTLQLKMVNPADASDVLKIGDPIVYSASQLRAQGDAVAKNEQTGKLYSTVSGALSEAKSGETVIVLKNHNEKSGLVLVNGVTLDLNGCALEAAYVSAFAKNYVVDRSNGAGLLKTGKGYVMLQKDNPMLPIRNGAEGYVFTKYSKYQDAVTFTDEKAKFQFLPSYDRATDALLAAGTANSGVTLEVRISWTSNSNTYSQSYAYGDDLIQGVYTSYNETKGRYDKSFTLEMFSSNKTLTFEAVFVSETGVEITCSK